MIKWGLISEIDSKILMDTIDFIIAGNLGLVINICEVGVYSGQSGKGVKEYIASKNHQSFITGIDNNRDGEILRFTYDRFIAGNSAEVYTQIEDESQDIVIIDGCHTFPAVVADFYCYAPKVKVGGYLLFHDTGEHIDRLSGWQGVGDKNSPDMCLGGVRKALHEIGLFGFFTNNAFSEMEVGNNKFKLIFDNADPNDTAGGFCVFKKMY